MKNENQKIRVWLEGPAFDVLNLREDDVIARRVNAVFERYGEILKSLAECWSPHEQYALSPLVKSRSWIPAATIRELPKLYKAQTGHNPDLYKKLKGATYAELVALVELCR